MKEHFSKTTNLTHRPFEIKINHNNTTKYGDNSIWSLGNHIWNSLPSEIKEKTDYEIFKSYINNWLSLKYKCIMCSFLNIKTTLSTPDYELGFNLFNHVTVLFYVVVLFVLYIFTTKLLLIFILIFINRE